MPANTFPSFLRSKLDGTSIAHVAAELRRLGVNLTDSTVYRWFTLAADRRGRLRGLRDADRQGQGQEPGQALAV